MNETWQRFLSGQGAEFGVSPSAPLVPSFGAAAAEVQAAIGGDAIAPLAGSAALRIEGPDASTFLNGQFTLDVTAQSDRRHALGAYCNVKGRVLATFRMFRRNEGWVLTLPPRSIPALVDKLRLYRVAARVEIDPVESVVGVGIAGGEATEAFLSHAKLGEIDPGGVATSGPLSVSSEPRARERLLVFGPIEAIAGVWEVVAEQATKCGEEAWGLLDVRSRIPLLEPESSETFLPQMLGLVELEAVSFEKGCFPGQEVVARTQHLGQVKRVLRRARCAAGELPAAGAPILSCAGETMRAGGAVVAAARDEEGRAELLAVVPRAVEGSDLRLGDGEGPHVEILDEIP